MSGASAQRDLRDWGLAQAVLSACWSLEEDGRGGEAAMARAERLLRL
jgi:streptomycin 6-kinase